MSWYAGRGESLERFSYLLRAEKVHPIIGYRLPLRSDSHNLPVVNPERVQEVFDHLPGVSRHGVYECIWAAGSWVRVKIDSIGPRLVELIPKVCFSAFEFELLPMIPVVLEIGGGLRFCKCFI